MTRPLRSESPQPRRSVSGAWRKIWRYRALYLMMLLPLSYYAVFQYGPMYGTLVAFKDFNILKGVWDSPWADPWYKHFAYFFNSPYFGQLLTNTLLISLYKLVFGMVPPVVLAIMLSETRVGWIKRWTQTLSYMPHFLSWVIIYGIAVILLSQDAGLINQLFRQLGLQPVAFLTSPEWFRSLLVGTDIWQNAGWGAIIYLAAIANIDPTLYEAAEMDGASRWQRIWHITLPSIRNVILLILVIRLGFILNAGFEQVYVFANIQVLAVGDIIDTWVYRTGLQQFNFSLGAAVGLFKSVIGLALALGANQLARRWGGGLW